MTVGAPPAPRVARSGTDAPPPAGARVPAILLAALVLSACSLVYELVAAQTLALLTANAVVWFSLVVGVFLASMGVGSWRSGRVPDDDLWSALVRIELKLTLLGASMVPVIQVGHFLYSYLHLHGWEQLGVACVHVPAALLVVGVGWLSGAELPILMRLAAGPRDDRPAANAVLGVDYLGALVGGLLFPLVLLPALPLFGVSLLVAAVNLAVAAIITAVRLQGAPRGGRRWAALGATAALLLAGISLAAPVQAWMLKGYYYYIEASTHEDGLAHRLGALDDYPEVLRARSPYQRIDLVYDPNPGLSATLMGAYSEKLRRAPDYPVDHMLCLNGAFQTNTRYDEIYHEWFVHVPVVALGKVPERVLLLGGGDGLVLRELVKYDEVRSIRHVDIDPVLVELAMDHPVLRTANANALRDPRIERTFDDGFRWVREHDGPYDAVFIDFPYATDYDLAKLYSREFFARIRELVAPGGFAVFDATSISILSDASDDPEGRRFVDTSVNDWPIYRDTLRAAGFAPAEIRPYLTTLEPYPPRLLEVLEGDGMELPADVSVIEALDEAEAAGDEQRVQEIRAALVATTMEQHVVALEQGFVLLAPGAPDGGPAPWSDPGVRLDVLDGTRYDLAFRVDFPFPEAVDPSLVNTILRPTLPTIPWWDPRLPY